MHKTYEKTGVLPGHGTKHYKDVPLNLNSSTFLALRLGG